MYFKITLKSYDAETGNFTFEVIADNDVFNRAIAAANEKKSIHAFDLALEMLSNGFDIPNGSEDVTYPANVSTEIDV